MNGFDWGAFGVVTLASLLAIAVGMAVTARSVYGSGVTTLSTCRGAPASF